MAIRSTGRMGGGSLWGKGQGRCMSGFNPIKRRSMDRARIIGVIISGNQALTKATGWVARYYYGVAVGTEREAGMVRRHVRAMKGQKQLVLDVYARHMLTVRFI